MKSRCSLEWWNSYQRVVATTSQSLFSENAPRLRRLESDAAKDLYCACGSNELARSLTCTEDLISHPVVRDLLVLASSAEFTPRPLRRGGAVMEISTRYIGLRL